VSSVLRAPCHFKAVVCPLSVRFPRLSFIYTHQSKTDPEAKLYRKGGGQEARLLGPHSVVTIAAREQQTQDA
jgi:hypothetical protein